MTATIARVLEVLTQDNRKVPQYAVLDYTGAMDCESCIDEEGTIATRYSSNSYWYGNEIAPRLLAKHRAARPYVVSR